MPSSKSQGIVFNIQRWSLNDGSGIRSVVFLKGCPLSCYLFSRVRRLTGDSCGGHPGEKCPSPCIAGVTQKGTGHEARLTDFHDSPRFRQVCSPLGAVLLGLIN
jgi:hypothetical protein